MSQFVHAICPSCGRHIGAMAADHYDQYTLQCKECGAEFRVSRFGKFDGTTAPAGEPATSEGGEA